MMSKLTEGNTMEVCGYPKEIFKDGNVNTKYLCGICKFILRNPVQGSCGHRLCKQCLVNATQRGKGERVLCPACKEADDVDEETSYLNEAESFPDNAVKRELAKVSVKCSHTGCSWSGSFKDYEVHYDQCEHRPLICEICNKLITKAEMFLHKASHEGCPFKCSNQVSGEDIMTHLSKNVVEHLNIVHERVDKLEADCGSSRASGSSGTMAGSFGSRVESLEEGLRRLKEQVKGTMIGMASVEDAGGAANGDIDARLHMYDNVLTVLNKEIEKLFTHVDAARQQADSDRAQVAELETRVKTLERQLVVKDTVIAELDMRAAALETTSYDGTLLWRINNMKQRREEARSGKTPSFYSPPFFTSKTGYKVCARIYLNGDGVGKGTHISLFFVIMRGMYDALLEWPFKRRVTLMFIDQNQRNHVSDSFYPDIASSSFQRPTTEMNIASGCPKLMPLTNLDNSSAGYVKDDVSFIKIIVNSDSVPRS